MNPDDARARVLAQVARTPSRTRRQERWRSFASLALAVTVTAALLFGIGGVDLGARPPALVMFTSTAALLVAMALSRATSRSGARSMLGPRPAVLVTAVLAAMPLLGVLSLVAAALWPSSMDEPVPGHGDMTCATLTLVEALAPLMVLVVPRRRSEPRWPTLTGAALGATAGAWSATMAFVRCPHMAMMHGIVAHATPVLVTAAAGALLGRALLPLRSTDRDPPSGGGA